jgi:hypothetical protein
MVRYGHMLKAGLGKIRVHARIEWYSEGSVMAGTIASRCRGLRSRVEVESDEDPALIAALIHNARGGCYAEAALVEPVPVETQAVLNGEPLDLDAHPRKPPRGRRRG